jgi:hypothetical protein
LRTIEIALGVRTTVLVPAIDLRSLNASAALKLEFVTGVAAWGFVGVTDHRTRKGRGVRDWTADLSRIIYFSGGHIWVYSSQI